VHPDAPSLRLGSRCLAAGVGFQPLENFRKPPHGVRVPVLPELKSSRKITGIHQPPNVGTAERYPKRFQSLPINHLLFHCKAPEVGAVATAALAADARNLAHWEFRERRTEKFFRKGAMFFRRLGERLQSNGRAEVLLRCSNLDAIEGTRDSSRTSPIRRN
jgi:hypothetical protein